MRMRLPIQGTVVADHPHLGGDEKDPIRLVDVDLGHVSWRMAGLDLEAEEMIIEVSPAPYISEATGERTPQGTPIFVQRKTSPGERQGFLNVARQRADAVPRTKRLKVLLR